MSHIQTRCVHTNSIFHPIPPYPPIFLTPPCSPTLNTPFFNPCTTGSEATANVWHANSFFGLPARACGVIRSGAFLRWLTHAHNRTHTHTHTLTYIMCRDGQVMCAFARSNERNNSLCCVCAHVCECAPCQMVDKLCSCSIIGGGGGGGADRRAMSRAIMIRRTRSQFVVYVCCSSRFVFFAGFIGCLRAIIIAQICALSRNAVKRVSRFPQRLPQN